MNDHHLLLASFGNHETLTVIELALRRHTNVALNRKDLGGGLWGLEAVIPRKRLTPPLKQRLLTLTRNVILHELMFALRNAEDLIPPGLMHQVNGMAHELADPPLTPVTV